MKRNLLIISCCFLLAACQQEDGRDLFDDQDTILVLVDGRPVTLPMLEFLMEHRSVDEDDTEGMRELLDELIRIRVMANAAENEGVAGRQRVRAERAVKDMEILYVRFLEEYQQQNPVTDAEIERLYEDQRHRAGDTHYQIETLKFDSQPEALLALATIEDGEREFAELARSEGLAVESPVWIDLSQVPDEFAGQLQRTEPGEVVSALLPFRGEWRLARLAGTRPLQAPELDEVRHGIGRTLARQRSQALIDELYEDAEIEPMLPID